MPKSQAMAKPFFLTLLAVFLVGNEPIYASQKYKCKMHWTSLTQSTVAKTFDLQEQSKIRPFPNTLVTLAGDLKQSKVTIKQSFDKTITGTSRVFILYEFQCDFTLLCKGSRTKKTETKTIQTPFDMVPTTDAIAKIKDRKVFEFWENPNGFKYDFIEYTLEDGQEFGMEVECNE